MRVCLRAQRPRSHPARPGPPRIRAPLRRARVIAAARFRRGSCASDTLLCHGLLAPDARGQERAPPAPPSPGSSASAAESCFASLPEGGGGGTLRARAGSPRGSKCRRRPQANPSSRASDLAAILGPKCSPPPRRRASARSGRKECGRAGGALARGTTHAAGRWTKQAPRGVT